MLPEEIAEPATGDPLVLRRAWPRTAGGLDLEYERVDGTTVVGSWRSGAGHGNDVVLHPRGRDHRLPALASLLNDDGGALVAHRPGRRAVVRLGGPGGVRYAKAVRPGRSTEIASKSAVVAEAAGTAFAVPRLLAHDPDVGLLVWSELAGHPLHTHGADPTWPVERVAKAWECAGRAINALHRTRVPGISATHDATAEAATVHRWLDPAMSYGLLPPAPVDRQLRELVEEPPERGGVLHRDLHDKQLILRPDERIGLIDVDTVAVGEPALDIANVVVHLELRVLQRLLTARQATAAKEAWLRGVSPSADTMRRIAPYARATRLRLAGVYAFRPRWRGVAEQMLDRALAV